MPPISIFFSYAHEDEDLMDEVRRQLVIFERQGKIVKWHDRKIPAGLAWEPEIDHRLRSSHIILLFVSPAFLESRYCWDVEVTIALQRHEQGTARVIPIILRPCAWDAAPFGRLQALPKDAKPLTQAPDRDQATLDIARAILTVSEQLAGETRIETPAPAGGRPRGPYREKMPGDRIPRIMVPFQPPRGINIPPGYQRRLNYIAAEARRDSAARSDTGGFSYPGQFVGPKSAVDAFLARVSTLGDASGIGMTGDGPVEVWFEFAGDAPPAALQDLALASGLSIVHCGVTLVGTPS